MSILRNCATALEEYTNRKVALSFRMHGHRPTSTRTRHRHKHRHRHRHTAGRQPAGSRDNIKLHASGARIYYTYVPVSTSTCMYPVECTCISVYLHMRLWERAYNYETGLQSLEGSPRTLEFGGNIISK